MFSSRFYLILVMLLASGAVIILTIAWYCDHHNGKSTSVTPSTKVDFIKKNVNRAIEPVVLVHGGAGSIPYSREHGKRMGCIVAAKLGHEKLMATGSVLDAVEAAVQSMELDECFNAGYGSVVNYDGNVEMEASIMNGSNLNAGGCSIVQDVQHPITLAKHVMLKTNHTFLGGPNVMKFAREQGFEILPSGSLVTEFAKQALESFKRKKEAGMDVSDPITELGPEHESRGTVGAVAIDRFGNVAAATSSGGTTGKIPGRIGGTVVIGAGTYADNELGAVCCTGSGEAIFRYSIAQRILQRIGLLGESAQTATESVYHEMERRPLTKTGSIALDKHGNVGVYFNAAKMAWAYRKGGKVHSGVHPGEEFIENA